MTRPESIFVLAGRVGGHARAARYDGVEMTAKARQTFADSFLEGHECRVCPATTLPDNLLPAERQRRVEALRREHFARVALASARSRAKKKATADQGGRHGGSGGSSTVTLARRS